MPLSAIAFVTLFFGSALAGLARWPLLAVGAYLLSFYVHPPSRWWGALLPDLRWALLSGAAAIVAALMYRSRNTEGKAWAADPIVVLVSSYVAWMWIQTPWAVDQATHIDGTIMMTKYLLIVFVLIKVLDKPRALELFGVMHVLGCAYLGWLAMQLGTGGSRLDGVGGPGVDDANTLGMMLATGVIVGGAQLVTGPVWSRVLVGACLPVILNGLILTQSRGAFLGLALGGVVLVMLAPKGTKATLRSFAILGLLALLALAHQEFWQRIQTIGAEQPQRDFSAQTRVVLAQAQLRMFADHPFGAGHRGTAALSRQYVGKEYLAKEYQVAESKRARSSHNTFLTILVEQGVIGAVIFVVLVVLAFRRVMRVRRNPQSDEARRLALQGAAVGASLAVVFAAGQFTDYLRAEVQMWLFAMLVAVTRMLEALPRTATQAQASVSYPGSNERTPVV